MKTKISLLLFVSLLSLNNFAQTYFFQDAVENGSIWHAAASEVANPLSDGVNFSSICIQNTGTSGWQDTQIFPFKYTIQTGDMIYISYHNPNGALATQIRMDLSITGNFTWIGQPAIDSGTDTAWKEIALDLSAYVGEDITKIQIYPAAGESKSVYFDNIYISTNSTLSTVKSIFEDDKVFVSVAGNITFFKKQTNTSLSVYDLTGRLIIEEKINGYQGQKVLKQKGIYLLKVKSERGIGSYKIAFD